MPWIVCRVVWGLELVIATFCPTRALVSVDLPAFGRPTRQANPARYAASVPSASVNKSARDELLRPMSDMSADRSSAAEMLASAAGSASTSGPVADRSGPRRRSSVMGLLLLQHP